IYDCLTNYCELVFAPGSWWLYSNMGMGLAGHVVGRVDGTSYETVLTREVFDVLGMENSSLFLTDQQRTNLATGHNSTLTMVPMWTAQDIFQGAGFIKSSANDMLTYMEANLGLVQSPLKPAMDLTHEPQFHQGSLGEMGLGWYIQELDDGQVVIQHGGGTGGFDSYLGFNKAESIGAVILFNAKVNESVYVIGERVLKAIRKYP
ncbi:MAG: serine hydrolase domain-containing protein, partial [Bacteroidota bacterium]